MAILVLFSCFVAASAGIAPKAWGAEASAHQLFFTAQQDNFDAENTNTWQMAYYVNESYWAGPGSNAPVFIELGGEGPSSGGYVSGKTFVNPWLEETGALHFGLEHRYYGCERNASSCPYDASTTDHLRFLSSRQAIADVATFVKFATEKYGLGPKAKWVAIGGSYSGMLAAFVRAEYPELIHSSVASSAPVKGKLDMTEFEDIVSRAYSLNVEGIDGSPECRDAIAYGHHAVGSLLGSAEGRHQLAELFPTAVESAEWLDRPANQRAFAGCGVASFPAQGNSPSCTEPGCGIRQICEIMTNRSLGTPLLRLAALRAAQDGAEEGHSCEMDWEMPGGIPSNGSAAYWAYQTCTEFGFYQTCEVGSDCFFTQGLVSFQNPHHKPNDFCSQLWGLSTEETVAKIASTSAYYHAKIANVTRIMWVNGDVDPWHGLSHVSPPGLEQPVIFPVSGAAHCAWMDAERPSDQRSLVEARKAIWSHLAPWLRDEGTGVITV